VTRGRSWRRKQNADHRERVHLPPGQGGAQERPALHEVRRCYPFVPLLTGRFVRDYEWKDQVLRRRSFMVP